MAAPCFLGLVGRLGSAPWHIRPCPHVWLIWPNGAIFKKSRTCAPRYEYPMGKRPNQYGSPQIAKYCYLHIEPVISGIFVATALLFSPLTTARRHVSNQHTTRNRRDAHGSPWSGKYGYMRIESATYWISPADVLLFSPPPAASHQSNIQRESAATPADRNGPRNEGFRWKNPLPPKKISAALQVRKIASTI